MRLILAAGSLAFFVCGAAFAQTCEVMTIKNSAGQIVSNSMMCVDETGAWIDPATANLTPEPLQYPRAERENPSNILAKPLPVQVLAPEPVVVIPQPLEKPLPPLIYSEPIAEPPLLLSTPQPALSAIQPVPSPATVLDTPPLATVQATPVPTAQGWQPTSGTAKRTALYAKLGLVCKARKAKFCGDVPCTGLCEGKRGWCDGKTGEVHASLEAIERLYCRKKRK